MTTLAKSEAARLSLALGPRHNTAAHLAQMERFAADAIAEAGHDVLHRIVQHVEQHRALTALIRA